MEKLVVMRITFLIKILGMSPVLEELSIPWKRGVFFPGFPFFPGFTARGENRNDPDPARSIRTGKKDNDSTEK